MLPGDLLLSSATKPNLSARLIALAQKQGGFGEEHACWTHAAVYVGRHYVVEAVATGVRYGPMFAYVDGYRLRARRDPTLSMEQRYQIVIQALTRLGERYGFMAIPRLAFGSIKGYWTQRPSLERTPAVICSQVFADSYALVTNRFVVPGVPSDIKPSDLSATPVLEDVPLEWRRVL